MKELVELLKSKSTWRAGIHNSHHTMLPIALKIVEYH